MTKFTIWFLLGVISSFIVIITKLIGFNNFELTDEYKKKAILDGNIVSKIDDIKIDVENLKFVKKAVSLKEFYLKNNK